MYRVAKGLAGDSVAGEAVQQQAPQRHLEGPVRTMEDRQAAGHPVAFDQLRAL
jgi:hypothetical protein